MKSRTYLKRLVFDKVSEIILSIFGIFSIFITVAIIFVLINDSLPFFRDINILKFLTDTEWTPLFVTKKYGILPLVCGTFLIVIVALSVAVPFGIAITIYISEIAPARVREIIKVFIEFLASIPTVVYGYFALLWFTPTLQKIFPNLETFNAFSPGIVVGIMILPYVISISEDAMRSVPQSLREGSYALGATRLYTAFKIVIPAAFPGISAAYILGISRALGETMIVAIAAGMLPQLTLNPFEPVQTMTAYIVQVALGDVPHGTFEYATIFAVGLTLFVITLFFNTAAFILKERVSAKFGK